MGKDEMLVLKDWLDSISSLKKEFDIIQNFSTKDCRYSALNICTYDDDIQLFREGIEDLAESIGRDIEVFNRRDDVGKAELGFWYDGIRFFCLIEKGKEVELWEKYIGG